jgi:hypothetical protein|tara:strand:+ start:156 stop:620 length:465 start_codon:yes stop_codon:yes gene_type:complete
MSKQVEIRQSRQEDILPIAHRMREADVKEIWASHRATPYKALVTGFKAEGNCWTILGDGIPEGMIGVTRKSLLSNNGIAWLLGTDVLSQEKRQFVELTKKLFDDAVEGFDYLENYISVDNRLSLRWLQALGFTIEDEIINMNGTPFKKFYMERN